MTSRLNHIDPVAVDRYLAGTAAPDEAALLEQAFGHPSVIRAQANISPDQLDTDADWAALSKRLHLQVPQSQLTRRPVGYLSGIRTWRYLASGLFAGVLAILGAWYGGARQLSTRMSEQMSSYTTAPGHRATIALPDGSTVVLNVGSRLQVPANYADGNRTLHLTGEAFFVVTPDPDAPFQVVAGPSTTRVLGTKFAVRYYAIDTAATISVQDGKVAVDSMVLTASQQTTVSARGIAPVSTSTPGQFTFARGILTLNKVSFSTAVTELSRWYDADIRIGSPALASRRIVGEFAAGSLADLTEILELSFHVRIVRDGRVLTLYSR